MAQRRQAALRTFGGQPFTREQAIAAGLTANDLRSSAVQAVLRGVFLSADVTLTHSLRCQAALLAVPGARVSHVDAARLLGLPAPRLAGVRLSCGARQRSRVDGVLTRAHLPGSETMLKRLSGGERIAVTAPIDIVRECARDLSLVDAVVLADAVLALAYVDVVEALTRWSQETGVRRSRLREIVRLCDERAESPMETRLRLLLILAGFPTPTCQHVVHLPRGSRRLDLAYPDVKVAIEYDGGHHWADQRQRRDDVARDYDLRAAGWEVVHVIGDGVFSQPGDTLTRVRDVLASRGVAVRPTSAWAEHFGRRAA